MMVLLKKVTQVVLPSNDSLPYLLPAGLPSNLSY